MTPVRDRQTDRPRHPEARNWVQLLQFGLVGASGYIVNLAVFAVMVGPLDIHHIPPRSRLLRRGVEQLLVEPPLDLRREARTRRLPGRAILHGQRACADRQPDRARAAGARAGWAISPPRRSRWRSRCPSISSATSCGRSSSPSALPRRLPSAHRDHAAAGPRRRRAAEDHSDEGDRNRQARPQGVAASEQHPDLSPSASRNPVDGPLGGRLLHRRQGGRPGRGRPEQRQHRRVLDRLPGRLANGPRLSGRLRPNGQRALHLAPPLRDLRPRPARLAPAVPARPPRPAGDRRRVRALALLLQQGQHRGFGAARLPAAALPARRERSGSASAAARGSRTAALDPDRRPGRRRPSC